MQLERGQYAYTEHTDYPDWYLGHLLAGAADVKWDALTADEQQAVIEESARRQAKSEKDEEGGEDEGGETVTEPAPTPEPTPEPEVPVEPVVEPEPEVETRTASTASRRGRR